ncbi:MAG: glycosyltransferase family 4 protein [Hyphomicrobium sp.]|jgi:glycosyltransferase involved in cell wall biosynthesis
MPSRIDRVVVINDDSVQSGGAAAIALASLQEMRARGLAVTLITGDDGTNPELARMGVDVVALNGRHVFNGQRPAIARGLFDRDTAQRIGAWIRQNDTPHTVYHLHNWHKVLSPSAFLPMRRVARRLIITAHDYFLACPNGGYFNYPRGELCCLRPMSASCLVQACDKRNYGHKLWRVLRGEIRHRAMNLRSSAATVIAVHEGMVPLLTPTVDHGAIRVLRNPSMPWLTTRVAAERNRRLLFVGRLEHDKGVMHLAKAARIAGAPLRIIGSGPLASILRCDFPEVELAGWRSKEEIGRMCRDVRALVMPSQWRETFGLAAVEAAMSGIPTIVSRASLICGDLERLGIGIGCDAQDVTAMANTIKRVMAEDDLVAEMSHNGFARGRCLSPTPSDWGDLLIELYAEKLAGAEIGQAASRRTRSMPTTIETARV